MVSFGVSAAPPPCDVPGCYSDYFAATGAIAIDSSGHMVFAYTFGATANGRKSLYVQTSDDGVHWGGQLLVNGDGDSSVPQIAAGPTAGDFRLAWQDDSTGEFNT